MDKISPVPFRSFKFPVLMMDEHEIDNLYDDHPMLNVDEDTYRPIGKIIVGFSAIEHGVEEYIGMFYDMSNYEIGRSVVKYLGAVEKFKLFNELMNAIVARSNDPDRTNTQKQLWNVRKMLVNVAEIRNIVAHAMWYERTADGYTKSSYRQNKDSGKFDFMLYKLDIENLDLAEQYMESVTHELSYVVEYVFELSDTLE